MHLNTIIIRKPIDCNAILVIYRQLVLVETVYIILVEVVKLVFYINVSQTFYTYIPPTSLKIFYVPAI